MTVLQNGAGKFELALGTYREIFEADQNSNVKWIDSLTVYSSVLKRRTLHTCFIQHRRIAPSGFMSNSVINMAEGHKHSENL